MCVWCGVCVCVGGVVCVCVYGWCVCVCVGGVCVGGGWCGVYKKGRRDKVCMIIQDLGRVWRAVHALHHFGCGI